VERTDDGDEHLRGILRLVVGVQELDVPRDDGVGVETAEEGQLLLIPD
jgi:hypothetical protein